ncbi:MAG TPA: hypothetical protein RMH99_24210 [Sandaracinaceae bacterium LLY-WYZ-13_1]|nr:hypothetical protein [Sandaracinaceae bacterium LLY-WYZ-13_1]
MRRPLLLHPVLLIGLGTWALNDHVLKAAFAAGWTGKLSDVASLIAFPLLAAGAFELCTRRGLGRAELPVVAFWSAATGFVMATINTLPDAAWAYRHGLGLAQWLALGAQGTPHTVRLTVDPTDLWTLPALAVPLALAWLRRPPASEGRPVAAPA